jgi:AraC-like DNA-binding protein
MAMLAAETGFADQAHLTRAIVSLTGRTPKRLTG